MANVLRGEQNPVFDSSYENRRRLLYDFVNRFKENTEHIENNELINIIKKKPRTEKIPITTLEAKTGGFSADTQEKVKDAWSTLIGDDTTADLALDLFYYNMLRSGFDFSPKTFMHLASTIVKMLVPGYIDNIADVNFNDDRMLGLGADFLTMFRRNHSSNFRIVPNLDKNSKLKVGMEKTLDQKNVLYTFNFNKNKNLINPITLLGEDTFAPMITYDDTLLVYHSNGNGFVQYVSTSPLGNNNNAIEYDANMGGLEMMSAISESTLNME